MPAHLPLLPKVMAGLLLAGGPPATPVDTLRALGPALTACFQAPAGTAGSEVTVRFSLDAHGALIGKPRVTFAHLTRGPEEARAFVGAVLAALDRCVPVAVTPALGQAIAGRPLAVRFRAEAPAQPI